MNGYREIIIEATGCSADDVAMIEEVMRNVVFHSTLDWRTREELEEGARLACAVLDHMSHNGE